MGWDDLAKLLHIGVAFAFVSGLLGRWFLLERAARSVDVETAYHLSQAAAPFEKLVIRGSMFIIPAGFLTAWAQGYPWLGLTTGWMLASVILLLSTLPFVPLVFLPKGRVFEAEMAAARSAGSVTAGLRAAFSDPIVAFGHWYERGVAAVVIVLMVLKPF
jgi:hypothetical protein